MMEPGSARGRMGMMEPGSARGRMGMKETWSVRGKRRAIKVPSSQTPRCWMPCRFEAVMVSYAGKVGNGKPLQTGIRLKE